MKSIVRQCFGLLAFLVFTGSYAYADSYGSALLTICNKGSEPINVVVALKDRLWPVVHTWEVSGWKSIAPGHCELVYRELGRPAYIGFGFADSQGHITYAGHIDQAPDFGWNGFARVLTKAEKRVCVRSQGMAYEIRDDPTPALDCASFHSDGKDPGGYVPLASALYFLPVPMHCWDTGIAGQPPCSGGDYYLNVKPTANDRDLHASVGSESGNDQSATEPGIGDAIIKALGNAAEENRKAQAALQPFVDACVEFFRSLDRYDERHVGWCNCLSNHYRGVMTSEEEARYAHDFERLFWNGIAEPRSTDPAWPRLHPAVNACAL